MIARVEGVCAETVHRRARRERWPSRLRGNRIVYAAPRRLGRQLEKASPMPSLLDQPRILRELLRASAVATFILEMRRNPGGGIENALATIASKYRRVFQVSPRVLRRWISAVERGGIVALRDRRPGNSGRKPAHLERIL